MTTYRKIDEGVPCGPIHLRFVTRMMQASEMRRLIVGFHIGDDPKGRLLICSESELLRFPKFQQRALEKGGIFVNHPAIDGTATGRKRWNDEVFAAMTAGQSVDANNVEGFTQVGGRT